MIKNADQKSRATFGEAVNPARRELDKLEINTLPVKKYEGPVTIVDDARQLAAAAKSLRLDKVLGFDIEIRPSFQRGERYLPAIVQLAAAEMVYIVQLQRLDSFEPLSLLFAEPVPIKVGVAIEEDLRRLREVFPFQPAGFLDLGKLSVKMGLKASGVRTLAANLFGIRISKSSARLSNWERHPLTPKQVSYAATDAWICREIYLRLAKGSKS